MANIVESKAGTGRSYVVVQGRMYPGKQLHIQGLGRESNRGYGISANVPVSAEMAFYIDKQAIVAESAAGTGKRYMEIRVRPRPDTLHFQIENGEFNRGYGAAFDVPASAAPELYQWLLEEIVFNQ